jgi:hypothetical protein
MIPAAELARFQADAAAWLDQTITVQHVTATRGAFAEATPSYGAGASVACLIGEPTNEDLRVWGAKVGDHVVWKVWVAPSADVRNGDLITLPGGVTGTAVGAGDIKSYTVYNDFLVVAVR